MYVGGVLVLVGLASHDGAQDRLLFWWDAVPLTCTTPGSDTRRELLELPGVQLAAPVKMQANVARWAIRLTVSRMGGHCDHPAWKQHR